jgi:hypothetical protein
VNPDDVDILMVKKNNKKREPLQNPLEQQEDILHQIKT